MSEENQLIKERLNKLNDIKELGVNPYPYSFDKKNNSKELLDKYSKLQAEEKVSDKVSIAGRIMQLRKMGKASFIHVQDEEGRLQAYLRQDDVGETAYKLFKKCDIGDFVGITGTIFKTKTGEVSVYASNFELLAKTTRPLPEKYHGLKDKELRYRQRYLDLIMNSEVKNTFQKRSLMIKTIRNYFDELGFMEVETPLLQTQYGGANARPFKTHINAWDMPMYLSISPELYLKRLTVGGLEKVYTICKNFRNEGVDHSHNPEFTMCELYQAYVDYNEMMKIIENTYEKCAIALNGDTKVKQVIRKKGKEDEEVILDFKAPWPKKTMAELIKKYADIDVLSSSKEELISFVKDNKIDLDKKDDFYSWGDLMLIIFEEFAESNLIQPTHVIDHPVESTPLCKKHRTDDRLIERFESFALGMELCNAYSELNDPIKQKELLELQEEKGRAGDDEHHPMDTDFINALEIGLPPTGGIGFGVDRMGILLTGVESIRDIILFPTMKPVKDEKTSEDQK